MPARERIPVGARRRRASRSICTGTAVRLVAVLAVLGLAGCGGDDDGAAATPTVSATTAPPGSLDPSESPSTSPDDAQVIAITVAGSQVTGAEPRTPVRIGTTIRLSVTADTADELHVHGYDVTERVTPGSTVQVEFVADRPGVFEVELHGSHTVLTRLQVQ